MLDGLFFGTATQGEAARRGRPRGAVRDQEDEQSHEANGKTEAAEEVQETAQQLLAQKLRKKEKNRRRAAAKKQAAAAAASCGEWRVAKQQDARAEHVARAGRDASAADDGVAARGGGTAQHWFAPRIGVVNGGGDRGGGTAACIEGCRRAMAPNWTE